MVRRGRAGESYVQCIGQVIDLEDLLLVAALPDDRPSNAVKNSWPRSSSESRNVLRLCTRQRHELASGSGHAHAPRYAGSPARDRIAPIDA